MLVPGLTVTVIGLVVGLMSGVVLQHAPLLRSILGGLVGAWAGFAAGALIGWLVDSVLPADSYGMMFGHALAVLGALGFVTSPRRMATSTGEWLPSGRSRTQGSRSSNGGWARKRGVWP